MIRQKVQQLDGWLNAGDNNRFSSIGIACMNRKCQVAAAFAVACLLFGPNIALSQGEAGSSPKGAQLVASLIVMQADGASLDGNTLTLSGVARNSIVFADRPVRSAGHAPTADILDEWSPSGEPGDSFAKDPPNATVSVFNKNGSGIRDAVVVLKSPQVSGDRVVFDVQVLEGDLTGADGPASIFIDIIGRPLTPLSVAGVERRATRRAVMYGGVGADACIDAP